MSLTVIKKGWMINHRKYLRIGFKKLKFTRRQPIYFYRSS